MEKEYSDEEAQRVLRDAINTQMSEEELQRGLTREQIYEIAGEIDLDRKFQKVVTTPAGFDFFMAIHDFIEHIELS